MTYVPAREDPSIHQEIKEITDRATIAQAKPNGLQALHRELCSNDAEMFIVWAGSLGRCDANDIAQRVLRSVLNIELEPDHLNETLRLVLRCADAVSPFLLERHITVCAVHAVRAAAKGAVRDDAKAALLAALGREFAWETLPSSQAFDFEPQRWGLLRRTVGRGKGFSVRSVRMEPTELLAMGVDLGASDERIRRTVIAMARAADAPLPVQRIALAEVETFLAHRSAQTSTFDNIPVSIGDTAVSCLSRGCSEPTPELAHKLVRAILREMPAVANMLGIPRVWKLSRPSRADGGA